MAAPFCITKYPDGFKLKFMYHPMLVKCVNNIPSVKANAKKAYLFNEKLVSLCLEKYGSPTVGYCIYKISLYFFKALLFISFSSLVRANPIYLQVWSLRRIHIHIRL